ncbi:PAS domain S-box protein [Roseateles sp. DAIF2]|uniref:PAS-domain containing protein n=1 Tax=Roseateles sp. DAIF2 TaxID=2714952 RepID=UPI0018A2E622|nr:PAS-domain containing protein [Roseateles sp. DAIF2]QPF73054.1 PAS domain S-box protein [Roseateles sp. DAIF2]
MQGIEDMAAAQRPPARQVRRRRAWPPLAAAGLVLVLGLALTLAACLWLSQRERQEAEEQFQRLSERIERELLRRLQLPVYGLNGARGLYAASREVRRHEFRAYVDSRDLEREFPGIRGFGFVERVLRPELPRFLAGMRDDHSADFQLQPPLTDAAPAEDLLIIKYIEPLAANLPAWGVDMGSEPVRREAVTRAVLSGQATLSGRVVLRQDQQRSPGLLLFVPIYRPGSDPQTPAQRWQALVGLVYTPMIAREVLHGLADVAEGMLELELHMGPDDPQGAMFVSHPDQAKARPLLTSDHAFRFGGTTLLLRTASLPAFEQRLLGQGTRWLGTAGALLSLSLAFAVWLLASGRARAEALARAMTADLQRLARVAQGTTNAVFSTDAALRINWVNEGFTRVTGYSAAEALGRTPGELLGSKQASPETLQTLEAAAASGQVCRVEILNRRKDGQLNWVETELQPLHDERGRLAGFIEIALDITERKAAAEQLWQERERLANIIEGTGAGTWEWNVQSGEVRFNERWAGMLGYTLEELAPLGYHSWTGLAHPEDLAASERALQRHLRGETPGYEAEVRVRHKEGHWVWVLSRGRLYAYTPTGEPLWVAGTHLDITERKRMEEELRDSEAVLERAGRIAGIGGWQIELPSMELHWTAQTFRIHELAPLRQPNLEEALEYFDLPGRLAIKAAVRRAFRDKEGADLELRLTTALGREIWVRAVAEPEFDGGRVVRINGTLQDITERRLLEDSMRRSNEVLRSVLDNLPCALSVFDAELRLVAHNQQFRSLLDFPDALFEPESRGEPVLFEEIIRYNARRGEYGEAEDVEAMVELIIERARHPSLHQFERVRPNGAALEVRGAPMPGGGFVTTYIDISERKRMEAERQRNAELMQVMLENLPCGLTMFDAQMRLMLHNSRYARMYELDEEFFADAPVTVEKVALLMQRRREYGEIDTREALAAAFTRARDAMRAPHFWERIRPGGLVLEMRSAPLPGGGFVTTYTDVSEQRRAAAELAQTLSVLKAVLDAASKVAIIATDRQRLISVFNRGAELMLGYRAEEVVGRRSTEMLHAPGELEALGREVSAELGRPIGGFAAMVHASQLDRERECHYVRRDGSLFPALRVVTEMRDADGGLYGYLGVAYDITRQKESEASLREAKAVAEQASAAKSQFLANMSHEIRTPMNAILGMLQLLSRTPLDSRQQDYVRKTKGAARSLLLLLNDILDFSKIEAGKMELDPQPFAPARLLEAVQVILQANLGARPLALRFELDPALPAGLLGDAPRLQQVLINLGGNALKFTDEGAVTLGLHLLAPVADERARLEFRISDTGIGIAPEHQAKIFAGFTQAEASTTRRYGGTGLGLAISQRLVRMMGGELRLDSAPGQGSRFFFALELPLADPPAEPVAQRGGTGRQRLAGLRLLVVEDNPNNQQVAQELLQDEGAEVELAGDGQQALDRLEAGERFDAVLMDVQMPVMDGYTATRAIRARPDWAGLPVIAMTANAMAADLEACRAAGMNEHVGKPFELDHLVAVIAGLVGRPVDAVAAIAPPAEAALPEPLQRRAAGAGLDLRGALHRLMGKTALFARMSRSFAAQAAGLPAALRERQAVGELRGAADELHAFKGLAATLGADRLAELASQGERQLKEEGRPLDPIWIEGLAGAIAQGSATLVELAAALDADAPAPSPQAAVVDGAAARVGLERLMALLRGSDMAALDALESLRAGQGVALAEAPLQGLDEAMARLDFPAALQYCEQLLGELSR